jgi:serine/threonine-protein kinase RsbW
MGNVRTTGESPIPAASDVAVVDCGTHAESRLELVLPATRENLAIIHETAERFLAGGLERSGSRARLADAMIALHEATTNVVRHAYRDQPEPGSIEVRAELLPTLLRLTVLDEGASYDPSRVPQPDFANPRDGGYGLHLMRSTMSKVAYSRRGGRNVLVMEKALDAERGESPA